MAMKMTSMERILTAATHNEPDVVPSIPLIVNAAARVTNIPLKVYAKDGKKRAEAQIATRTKYGTDGVASGVDLCHEAEAMGSKIRFPKDNIPSVEKHFIQEKKDIEKLKIPNPEKDARMPAMLECLNILSKHYGVNKLFPGYEGDCPIIGVFVGPFSMAGQLRGLERLLSDMKRDPEWVKELLEITTEAGLVYGRAQCQAGACVMVTLEPMAEAQILSTAQWDEFVQPYLEKYSKMVGEEGAVWLPYMAGDSTPILERFVQAGAPALGVDWFVDLVEAKRRVGDDLLIFGNVKPLTLLYGTVEEVVEETKECIRKAGKGGGFVTSSGCEIPPDSPPENIKALIDTSHKTAYPLKL